LGQTFLKTRLQADRQHGAVAFPPQYARNSTHLILIARVGQDRRRQSRVFNWQIFQTGLQTPPDSGVVCVLNSLFLFQTQ